VYRTRFGLPVEVPSLFTDKEITKMTVIGMENIRKPTFIISDKIIIKKDKKAASGNNLSMYHLQLSMVSVLDSFVDVDENFLYPQKCHDDNIS
jgi:hypothetical protein